MKIRWISTIVLLVTFFAVQGVGYGEDEQTCQPDVVVMFGNGVWNDAEDADESRRRLQKRLEVHVLGTELKGIIKYDVAHNPSEGALADLLETFEQNFQTEKSKFWRFLAGLDLMPDILQDKLKEIAAEINADIVSANPSIQEHIAVYDQYLSEENVVVLVAHSQGNLYGNIAHLGLDQQYIDGFGIVSVANPDSYIAGGGPYTTIDEDYIISPLQFVYPFALSPNLDNFTGPVNLADWSGHKFIESYMAAGHAAETVILDNVVNMINELSQPLSSCIPQFVIYTRSKFVLGDDEQSNEDVHAIFLATAWSDWTGTEIIETPPFYMANRGKFAPHRVRYYAKEVKKIFTVSGTAPYTFSVQARHTQMSGNHVGASKTFLESDPSRFGTLPAGTIFTWTEMFTLSETDEGAVTVIMQDANSYSLIPNPAPSWTGWLGHSDGSLEIH